MTVTRDRWGIPHISAGSLLEVVREQGRVTAADRTWQLEVERRRAEGTCAEVFGPTARDWDVLARRALLVDIARRAYAGLSPSARDFVDAYVAGVNETLATARTPEAPDLRPQPWQAWTPLAVFAVQHLLFSSFPSKLWRRHLAASVGEEGVDLFRMEGLPGGSNAFVVEGSLTASGLPVLAGDPHRVLEAPGCYAQVRLVCTDPGDRFDVAGFSFVGVPGIQHFGHAGSVAWGVTNAVADDEDVYDEQLARREGGVVALGAGGWEPVARREELLRVRTGADSFVAEPVEVLVTDRGPVVVGGPDDAEAFSLRAPSYVLGDLGFDTLPALLRARTAADVAAAFGDWVGPVDNLLVADAAGHVEHRLVGRVPERDPRRREALQRLPGLGRDGHGWTGWVEDLPRRTGAVLVTANDRAMPGQGCLGTDFAPPFRAKRIRARLDDLLADAPVTATQLGEVLADDLQTAGGALLEMIATLVDLTGGAAGLRDRLLAWDRRMAPDSVEAAQFAAVRASLVEAFATTPALADADGSPHGEVFGPWFDLRGRIRLALPTLLAADKPFGVDPLQAVAAALEQVAAEPDPPAWGERHVAVPLTPHQQFGLVAPAGAAPPVGLAGDDDCVQATRALGGTGACVHGPVARYVWDLAGDSRWVVPLGASGDPRSPHHHDQQVAWAAGGTVPLVRDGEEQP